jgi:hypothetical protein
MIHTPMILSGPDFKQANGGGSARSRTSISRRRFSRIENIAAPDSMRGRADY